MFHAPSLTLIVRWLALGVVSVDLALIAYILCRRAWRNRYYAWKDAAQNRYAGTINACLAGNLDLAAALPILVPRRRAEREAVEVLLLGALKDSTRRRATELLVALGYVEAWAGRAFGRRRARRLLQLTPPGHPFLELPEGPRRRFAAWRRLRVFSIARAVAVGKLGRLSPEFAGVFMREALRDCSPYVGRLSVAAIGRNRIPHGVPVLLEELRRAVEGETELPVRSLKTALVRYPITELRHFPVLLDHRNPRVRFLAVDTIREICRIAARTGAPAEAFPAALRTWFLQKGLRDEAADVRARSAAVIAQLRDAQALQALQKLLRDDNEFVRLHAVRACAAPSFAPLLGDLVQRITDPRWRVREAAVRAVAAFSTAGRQELSRFFLETRDRYASEQIANELQRSGALAQIASDLTAGNGEQATAFKVCAKVSHLGMDAVLTGLLADDGPVEVRARLMDVLSASNSPHFLAMLRRISGTETGGLQAQAQALLQSRMPLAAAAGEPN